MAQRLRHRLISGLAVVASALLLIGVQAGGAAAEPGRIQNDGAEGAVAGSYLVVFKDQRMSRVQARSTTERLAATYDSEVQVRYTTALQGFAGELSRGKALELAADPAVAWVEQNRVVTLDATQSPTPSWGLDRIDQANLPLNNSYTYPTTGAGVTAYIIDTGIRTTHTDFGGRATWGTNATGDGQNTDCNGHGTHVAGTVGGSTYGVAKGVRLVAVKVLDCAGSGTLAGVTAGIDWVTANHTSGPAVANMSLGGAGSSPTTEAAVRRSIADGVVYAIASGNSDANACGYTPARVAEAITVNATTSSDARASYSNYGTCTDIFAPGSSITSDWNTSNAATATLSGTSMATPHVSGAAALVLAASPAAAPAAVWTTLAARATAGKVTSAGTGSPNRLLRVSSSTPAGACAAKTNGSDVAIPDRATVTSTIAVSGCPGQSSSSSTVEVHIVHTYRGDLVVDLIAPDGTVYNLHNRAGGSADNLDATYVLDLSAEAANGTWTLRVRDAASGDTGRLDSWTLDL